MNQHPPPPGGWAPPQPSQPQPGGAPQRGSWYAQGSFPQQQPPPPMSPQQHPQMQQQYQPQPQAFGSPQQAQPRPFQQPQYSQPPPPPPRPQMSPASPAAPGAPRRQLDANQSNYLSSLGFSSGLIRAMSMAVNVYSLRFWIIDNSLSMTTRDSHRLVGSQNNIGMVDCTRWEEVGEDVSVHAEIAGRIMFPCRFVMLNAPYRGSGTFSVGERGPAAVPSEIQQAKNAVMRSAPTGATPLTQHVNDIYNAVAPMAPTLLREGKKVAVIVATDGLPSDAMGNEGTVIRQQFVDALCRLETLPVSVVVQLATDDESVVDFYNSIDKSFKNLPYDVLDDYYGEALEVYLRNPWLNYALALHRFRELGVHVPAIDHLDSEALSLSELHAFCSGLFAGGTPLPDPSLDWPNFLGGVLALQAREQSHFNPVTKRVAPWIDLNLLHSLYGRGFQLPAQLRQQIQSQMPPQPPPSPQGQRPVMQQRGSGAGYTGGYGQFQQSPQQQQQPAFGRPTPPPQQARPPMGQPQSQPGASPQRPPQAAAAPPPPSPRAGAPPPPPSPSAGQAPPPPPYSPPASSSSGGDGNAALKRSILTAWALTPPQYQSLRPVHELLCSVQSNFPPSHGLPPHAYFDKWKPFSSQAFVTGEAAVLKRAMRKMKFFLHPDKLPRDLTPDQSFVCTTLWHVLNDAMDVALPS